MGFICFLGCGSFHFVPCFPPFLGALGILWLAGFDHIFEDSWQLVTAQKLLQFCLCYLEDRGGEIIGTLFWMWVISVSAQVYCCCIIGAHYDLRVPYTTQFPSPWSRIFCLWQGHRMQSGPWVVIHGSAFPNTLPTNSTHHERWMVCG